MIVFGLLSIWIGIWLMAAPAVLEYSGSAAIHDRVVGPLIASFATIALWEATRPLRHLNQLIGFWLLLAPWMQSYAITDTVNSLLCGLILMVTSSIRGERKHRIGGGWSALFHKRAH